MKEIGGIPINIENRDKFIKENYGFIIKNVSDTTGKYVDLYNDEAFSIGLMAFNEAIDRYDEDRGYFHNFAKIVIKSRVLNYIKSEEKENEKESLDNLEDQGLQIKDDSTINYELREDIGAWKKDLEKFSISLDLLVEESPNHEDTRNRAIDISEKSSKDEEITDFLFEKLRLPIKKMSEKFNVSEKTIRYSKNFIISIIIVFFKNYQSLISWIRR